MQVMRAALDPVTPEILHAPFSCWAPDARTEIQSDPVTAAFVGCVCESVCVRVCIHGCVAGFSEPFLSRVEIQRGRVSSPFYHTQTETQQLPRALCPPCCLAI